VEEITAEDKLQISSEHDLQKVERGQKNLVNGLVARKHLTIDCRPSSHGEPAQDVLPRLTAALLESRKEHVDVSKVVLIGVKMTVEEVQKFGAAVGKVLEGGILELRVSTCDWGSGQLAGLAGVRFSSLTLHNVTGVTKDDILTFVDKRWSKQSRNGWLKKKLWERIESRRQKPLGQLLIKQCTLDAGQVGAMAGLQNDRSPKSLVLDLSGSTGVTRVDVLCFCCCYANFMHPKIENLSEACGDCEVKISLHPGKPPLFIIPALGTKALKQALDDLVEDAEQAEEDLQEYHHLPKKPTVRYRLDVSG